MAESIRCIKCGWYEIDHFELDLKDAGVNEISKGYEFPLFTDDDRVCIYKPESDSIFHFHYRPGSVHDSH